MNILIACVSLREDNQQFISGCLSSVVKIWGITIQRVIALVSNNKNDQKVLTIVNNINYFITNSNNFSISLYSGEIKLFDLCEKIKQKMKKLYHKI